MTQEHTRDDKPLLCPICKKAVRYCHPIEWRYGTWCHRECVDHEFLNEMNAGVCPYCRNEVTYRDCSEVRGGRWWHKSCLKQNDAWIPVSEKRPPDLQRKLVRTRRDHYVGYYNGSCWYVGGTFFEIYDVTHWMDLPPPPINP